MNTNELPATPGDEAPPVVDKKQREDIRPDGTHQRISEDQPTKVIERQDVPSQLEQLAKTLLHQSAPPNYAGEMGSEEALEDPDVDISLHPSRKTPVAGELWSISGEIHNRSTRPVWIVDAKTVLTLAPEMYGQSSQVGSQGAFFPTMTSRALDEVVRIDPGAKYSVVWKLDPVSTSGSPGALQRIRKRIFNAIRNYAFFNPGVFRPSNRMTDAKQFVLSMPGTDMEVRTGQEKSSRMN